MNAGRRAALLVTVAGVGVLLVALACEGLARVGEALRCRDQTDGWQVRHRDYGWINRPGATGWTHRCLHGAFEFETWSQVNSKGLRDEEHPYERSGAFRILLLGDSFMAGYQVAQDAIFAAQLERRLAAAVPRLRVEVVNGSTSAWGTDNQLRFYETEGYRYRPDLVLLAFDLTNDVFENGRSLVSGNGFWPDKPYFALRDGRLVLENHPLPPASPIVERLRSIAAWLERRSAAFRVLTSAGLVRILRMQPPEPSLDVLANASPLQVYLADYPPQWRDAWRVTRGLILRLRRAVLAHGSAFAVLIINPREEIAATRWDATRKTTPQLRGVALDLDEPHRLITRFLARRAIPTIELREAFRRAFGATNAEPGFFAWDIHWAPAGHELAARVAAERLLALGLVPSALHRDDGRGE